MSDEKNCRTAEIGVAPYADGSGFRYVVRAERVNHESTTLSIRQGSALLMVEGEHWEEIAEAAEKTLEFVE